MGKCVTSSMFKRNFKDFRSYIPYSLDQTSLSNSRSTSGSVKRNSRRSRIVAAPRLLFENTSTWTCLATRFQWQAHDSPEQVLIFFYISKGAGIS